MPKTRKLKVLLCAAEAVPLAKVGGLADVVGSLPAALKAGGVEARIIMPAHGCISLRHHRAKKISAIPIVVAGKKVKVSIYKARVNGVIFYLLSNKEYFGSDVYAGVNGKKYLFFSRSVITALEHISFKPDVIHAHDFHAAPVIAEIGAKARRSRPALVLTIHNLRHQGITPVKEATAFGFRPADFPTHGNGCINLLQAGIERADKITTVSPNYAAEILTKEYGCGLEQSLRRRRGDIVGILNGIDVKDYDPATDEHLAFNFLIGQRDVLNKEAVCSFLGLNPQLPLFAFIARLSAQKGLDLIVAADWAKQAARQPFQLIILGAGEEKFEKMAQSITDTIGKNARTIVAFDETIARNIYAACDYFLMPSIFEPCGLAQMIAMRYGGIPIVRETGGLKDTVMDGQTGLTFKRSIPGALTACLRRALNLYYGDQRRFRQIRSRCMKKDWSWSASAPLYRRLYESI